MLSWPHKGPRLCSSFGTSFVLAPPYPVFTLRKTTHKNARTRNHPGDYPETSRRPLLSLSQEQTPNPLLWLPHEACAKCIREGWTPKDTGRPCQHQHNRLDVGVTDPMKIGLDDFAKKRGLPVAAVVRLILEERLTRERPSAPLRDEASPDILETSPLVMSRRGAPSTDLVIATDLWSPLIPALKEQVSEQNFEIWLSAVRFVSADDQVLKLQVPNAFHQEYLGEHYLDLIKEQLQVQYRRIWEIEFTISRDAETLPTPEPAQEEILPPTPEELAALELSENKALIEAQEAELVLIERRHRGYDAQREAIRLAKLRHTIEEEERLASNAKQRTQLVASALPALVMRQPGNSQRHYTDHTRERNRKDGPSAFEVDTQFPNKRRPLPLKEKRKPKPDTS